PRRGMHDDPDHVCQRRGGGDGEGGGGDPVDTGDGLGQARDGGVGGDGGHDDEDQEDPVPAGGGEDGGEDEADEVELDQRADGADQQVALEAEALAQRDGGDHDHQEQREGELPPRKIDDAEAAGHHG